MYILQEYKCGSWMNYPAAPFETLEQLDLTATCIKRDVEAIRLRVLVVVDNCEEMAGTWSNNEWTWTFAKRYHNLKLHRKNLTNRSEKPK